MPVLHSEGHCWQGAGDGGHQDHPPGGDHHHRGPSPGGGHGGDGGGQTRVHPGPGEQDAG